MCKLSLHYVYNPCDGKLTEYDSQAKNVVFRIFSSIQTSKLADQLKDLLTRARYKTLDMKRFIKFHRS